MISIRVLPMIDQRSILNWYEAPLVASLLENATIIKSKVFRDLPFFSKMRGASWRDCRDGIHLLPPIKHLPIEFP